MKKLKVGINGMGRIGRTILKEFLDRPAGNYEIVAINTIGTIEDFVHLLKYDSISGILKYKVIIHENQIIINNNKIIFSNFQNPKEIPWEKQKVELIVDATGRFKDKESLSNHIRGTVKKVILCSPANNLDATFVVGINHHLYDPLKHHIISNASCTTNCIAPIARIIHSKFEIISGYMMTVHSYTSDQSLHDSAHSDLRRSRAAALSIIPTTTGATKALIQIIPELQGKLEGYSIRVPVSNVSLAELTLNVRNKMSKEIINQTLLEASETYLKGIMKFQVEKLVSTDYVGTRHSSVIDSNLTNVLGNTVKVVAWYDNEYGFSNRILDLISYISSKNKLGTL